MANWFVIFFSKKWKEITLLQFHPRAAVFLSTDFPLQTWKIGNRVRERCLASIAGEKPGRASLVKTRARKLIKSLLLLLFFTISTPAHFSSDGGDPLVSCKKKNCFSKISPERDGKNFRKFKLRSGLFEYEGATGGQEETSKRASAGGWVEWEFGEVKRAFEEKKSKVEELFSGPKMKKIKHT